MKRRVRAKPREKILRPLRPNAGFEAAYRRKLSDLVEEMARSVERWALAAYRANEPLAMDAPAVKIEASYVGGYRPWLATLDGEPLRTSKGATIRFGTEAAAVTAARRMAGEILPAAELQAAMEEMGDYWLARFDEASGRLAKFFGTGVERRTSAQMTSILRDGGFTVRLQMTPQVADVVAASVAENVQLIKSIPQQYLTQAQGHVMRSVQRGRDLDYLSKQLERQFGVTKRRAALIARDQNNKATSALQEARRKELGIEEAIWIHSGGGKHPRPKHVAANGKRYKVSEGLPIGDKGQHVFPGEEINCRCVSRSVIPGF